VVVYTKPATRTEVGQPLGTVAARLILETHGPVETMFIRMRDEAPGFDVYSRPQVAEGLSSSRSAKKRSQGGAGNLATVTARAPPEGLPKTPTASRAFGEEPTKERVGDRGEREHVRAGNAGTNPPPTSLPC
jgi:hypothetical protein